MYIVKDSHYLDEPAIETENKIRVRERKYPHFTDVEVKHRKIKFLV